MGRHGAPCRCRLQGVDPYDYLIDVLQRVATHPPCYVPQ
ncbi:transposase domain-containing protein [Acidithiobacillus sp. AMEEHan]